MTHLSPYNDEQKRMVEELTVEWIEDGEMRVKQLAKRILSRGSWASIAFKFQELDPKTKQYRRPKLTVRRWRWIGGQYKYQSKFNISGVKQLMEIMEFGSECFYDEIETFAKTGVQT
jgi:hypothetical protein